jgi:hypothetical protein
MKMQAAQTMRTTGLKRFTYNHLGAMALTLSLVVSAMTFATTLEITGDLPWQQESTVSALPSASQRFFEHKELRQEAIELQASKLYVNGATATDRTAQINKMRRFYEAKDARQATIEQSHTVGFSDRAAQIERMRDSGTPSQPPRSRNQGSGVGKQ